VVAEFSSREWEATVVATCMVLGFCHEVDEICTLLGCCTVYGGNCLQNYHQDLLKNG
jgi:hypothetical protein